MAYIKPTTAGAKYLQKQPTPADISAITAVRFYDKQYGSDGVGNTTYMLPKPYLPGTNTLWVFLNGQKLELWNEYVETNALTVTFTAARADTDVIEFLVVGAYRVDADELSAAFMQMPLHSNVIINGAMDVAQRGTSFIGITDGIFTLDRFLARVDGGGVITVSQSSDVPSDSNFTHSLKVEVTTAAASPGSTDFGYILQQIEGYNIRHLFGEPCTLSFWAKSSKTGSHALVMRNGGPDRTYASPFTIEVADTWENKEINFILPNHTDGTWGIDEDEGMRIHFTLMQGSGHEASEIGAWLEENHLGAPGCVNLLDTAGNTFFVTGVQLRKEVEASPFQHRKYAEELVLCQRYYYRLNGPWIGTGQVYTNRSFGARITFPTSMRVLPFQNFSAYSDIQVWDSSADLADSSFVDLDYQLNVDGASIRVERTGGGLTNGNAANVSLLASGWIEFDAEL